MDTRSVWGSIDGRVSAGRCMDGKVSRVRVGLSWGSAVPVRQLPLLSSVRRENILKTERCAPFFGHWATETMGSKELEFPQEFHDEWRRG